MSHSHTASYERVLVVLGLLLVAVTCLVQSRKIDCTRFVFAPKCRGVAAKRAEAAMINTDNDNLHSSLSKDRSLMEDWEGEDSGLSGWQRLQFLLNRVASQNSEDASEGDEDLWERLLASRSLRH